MQTIVRILIILAASLLVTGATYAVGQTEWASQQSMRPGGPPGEHEHEEERGPREGREGGEGGPRRGPPNFHAAAEILGITEDELMSALDGFPPNVEAASETLGIPVAQIEAAMEEAGTREGHGHEADPFSGRSLLGFGKTLIPIALVIALVTWGTKGIGARKQRRAKQM